jgi:hypothetical protein
MARKEEIRAADSVTIIDRRQREKAAPVSTAFKAFKEAVESHGDLETVNYWSETQRSSLVIVGTVENRAIKRLVGDEVDQDQSEGVIITWRTTDEGETLILAGTDDRGLTYALYELAEQIEIDGLDALATVERTIEYPDNEIRGIDRFIEGPIQDQWFYDDDFWEYYIAQLAKNRYNRFALITGYDTAFMSPPYPFFLDISGFEDIEVTADIDRTQTEHLERLNAIGELCDKYGLEFVFGIWQQKPWTENQGVLVEGLPEKNDAYAEYCSKGMYELLTRCPVIDGLQLRVNLEAGVRDDEANSATAEAFWREIITAVEDASQDREDDIALDLRAKGLTDRMIDWGLETGLDVTVPTKYTWEGTGLPYHPVQMREHELADIENLNRSRRYSYATLLEKPRYYDVLYRLWEIGTNRIFLWGDPDYARRFAKSAGFGDSRGFEVTSPLALKGGHYYLQDEQWPLFEEEALCHYEYEDERYWAWYRLFGRLGYSTDTDSDVWEREFRRRFDGAAGDIRAAYRAAGKVLPLLTSAHLTHHPALTNWMELDTGGALFAEHNENPRFEREDITYGNVEPGDPGLFYGINEYVDDALDGGLDGRYTPVQVADWLRHFAADARSAIDAAGEEVDPETHPEYRATRLDTRMLAGLAEYHAEKTYAAVALERYRETSDPEELQTAVEAMTVAEDRWESVADLGESTYHGDLVFGMGPENGDTGQWRDRLPELRADLKALHRELADTDVGPDATETAEWRDARSGSAPAQPSFELSVPESWTAGEDMPVTVETGELNRHGPVTLHYRHTNQTEGAFQTLKMEQTDRGYRAVVPGEYITSNWDLLVYVSTVTNDGDGVIVPGLYHATHAAPYRVVAIH